jgi:hypothetical protein
MTGTAPGRTGGPRHQQPYLRSRVILTSKARAGTESWYFGRRPHAGPGDELRERRYSYKRGIKCQPTLALLLLGD